MLKGNTAEPPGATLNAVGACGGVAVLHPFVYRSPRYSVPPGAITWSSRFRWSELPEGSSQTSVILRGTPFPTTFVFRAPVVRVPAGQTPVPMLHVPVVQH